MRYLSRTPPHPQRPSSQRPLAERTLVRNALTRNAPHRTSPHLDYHCAEGLFSPSAFAPGCMQDALAKQAGGLDVRWELPHTLLRLALARVESPVSNRFG